MKIASQAGHFSLQEFRHKRNWTFARPRRAIATRDKLNLATGWLKSLRNSVTRVAASAVLCGRPATGFLPSAIGRAVGGFEPVRRRNSMRRSTAPCNDNQRERPAA